MRVLIPDDHLLLREMLELMLASAGGFETSCAADFAAAMRVIAAGGPFDLVVLDLDMPGKDGLTGLARRWPRPAGRWR